VLWQLRIALKTLFHFSDYDVSQDVVTSKIVELLRGVEVSALKRINAEIVESLGERILGRMLW
jgi:hypothetical protein